MYGADEVEFIPKLLQENFGNHRLRLLFEGIINFDKNNLKVIGEEYIKKMSNISNNFERIYRQTTGKL